MPQNPFESPKFNPPLDDAEHRSFRLTPGVGKRLFENLSGASDLRKAMLVALIQQLPLLMISSLLLDGGRVFQIVAGSMLLFWIGFVALSITVRRRRIEMNTWPCLYLWLGFLPIIICQLSIFG